MWHSNEPVPREELLKKVQGKDAIFCALTDIIDVELLEHAGPNLKVIATVSVGYDHIDVAECKKRGIKIGYTPDVLTDATAELTIGLLLSTSRRLIEANKEVYNGGWSTWSPFWMCGNGLKNSVVGIFGFGRIGQEVAKRISPFKPKQIIYFGRSERLEAKEMNAKRVDINEFLSTGDFIIVTCSLTPETKEFFNEEVFSKMKPNAIFINTSRGGVVNQTALYNALKRGTIKAAGLDVTTPEPIALDHPLLTLSNCVILPHIGSADIDTRVEMSRITACNILSGLKGIKMISEL